MQVSLSFYFLFHYLLLSSSSSLLCEGIPSEWIFQSGPDHGNSYGSSIQFDTSTNQLFVTGSTYGSYWDGDDNSNDNDDSIPQSTCFLGIFHWEENKDNDDTPLSPLTRRVFPSPNGSPESCKQLLVTPGGGGDDDGSSTAPAAKVLMLGNTRSRGTLSELYQAGTTFQSPQYGMILDVDVNIAQDDDSSPKMNFLGGRLLQDGPVLYPMGMVTTKSAMRNTIGGVATAHATTASPDGYDEYYDDYDGYYSYTGGDLFVVSMQSYDERENYQHVNDAAIFATNDKYDDDDDDNDNDNNINGGNLRNRDNYLLEEQLEPDLNQILQFGSSYNLLVERFFASYDDYVEELQLQEYGDTAPSIMEEQLHLQETWIDTWRKPYSVHHKIGVEGTTIHVAGVTTFGADGLIVMGSTAGEGSIFGSRTYTSIDNDHSDNNNRKTNDVDGFVTLLSQSDGSYLNKTVRIESSNSQDDFITGFCQYDSDLYIVGTTHGQIDTTMDTFVKGEIHAFIMNIDLITFQTNWVKQIGGEALKHDEVHGIACDVTSHDDGAHIYFGGTTKNGASLALYGETSNGMDDIFVVQAATVNGRLNYIRQWGTSYDDRLMDITTDKNGNALVLGNTNGSILRLKKEQPIHQKNMDTTDIFIISVSFSDGTIQEPLNDYTTSSSGNQPNQNMNHPKPPTTTTATYHNSGKHESATSSPQDTNNDDSSNSSSSPQHPQQEEQNNVDHTSIVSGITMAIFFLVSLIVLYKTRDSWMPCFIHGEEGKAATDRKEVLKYLYGFDVDDIDLKHSATGGWHCNYTNDLAEGINSRNSSTTKEGGTGGSGGNLFPGWRHPGQSYPPRSPQESGLFSGSGSGSVKSSSSSTKNKKGRKSKTKSVMDPLIARDQHIDSLFFEEDHSKKEREQLQSFTDSNNDSRQVVDVLSKDNNSSNKPWIDDQAQKKKKNQESKDDSSQASKTDESKETWGADII